MAPEKCATDRATDQKAESRAPERHAYTASHRSQVARQAHHARVGHRSETAAEEPVHHRPYDQPDGILHRHPTEAQERGEEADGRQHVQRTDLVGVEIGQDSACRRAGVHDGEQIEAKVLVHVAFLNGVELHVRERDVDAHEAEEHGEIEKKKRCVLEQGGFE